MREASTTGLDFNNRLEPDSGLSMLNYMYFYNGAGIGAGDFNNDGLVDLYFAGNQESDRIYLNRGNLKFEDITQAAGIANDGNWSTGVSLVDINNDGMMDIYISVASGIATLKGKNKLWVCQRFQNGIPEYKEEAEKYGIDFSGLSTQAAFFDMDNDGDLDMFLLNHSFHQDGSFSARTNFLNSYDSLSGDRIFRNDEGYYTDITKESGIHSSAIGYGLGIVVSDINLDGFPDIYIGNDFHENDYLYINQGDGRFTDEFTKQITHSSQFSMGVDIADINNDALPDIISLDMLPDDPEILKRSLGEDAYDVYQLKRRSGYHPQYARNTLQLNRGNNLFSEIGLYAGVYATDWSWAPLWFDMDNDGLQDLFISNGIPKRLNDIDYINYISHTDFQNKLITGNIKSADFKELERFPEIRLPNKFFKNSRTLQFADQADHIENNQPSFSNGAVYADLDNDGDLDIVVSNINATVFLYENRSEDFGHPLNKTITLQGSPKNLSAIGSKILIFKKDSVRSFEKFPVRGFQSSMNTDLQISFAENDIDSVLLIWPDGRYQSIDLKNSENSIRVQYDSGLPLFDFTGFHKRATHRNYRVESIVTNSGFNYEHKENAFNEFDRELLLPHVLSSEGPALAIADINNDGREDIFIGSSRKNLSGLFLQNSEGRFVQTYSFALAADSMYEDVDAIWRDMNGDGFVDLLVASGGNEFYGNEAERKPRLYLNDGKGKLSKKEDAFPDIYLTASSLAVSDINGDGYADIFIGAKAIPWEYGKTPTSYLLLNNGSGLFTDITAEYSSELPQVGMVSAALWEDIDGDKIPDLILALQWGGIKAFLLKGKKLVAHQLTDRQGWWNFIVPIDINNDGHIDFVAGNLGYNSRLKADSARPVRLYYADFDNNGKKEQAMSYYIGNREVPFFNKMEMDKQMPSFKKRFLYAKDFSRASFRELLGAEKLDNAAVLRADEFGHALLINDGKGAFSFSLLPAAAQMSTYKDAQTIDANGDGFTDIVLGGNFYENSIALGQNSSDRGTLLINDKGRGFIVEILADTLMSGQIRKLRSIQVNNLPAFVLAKNNGAAQIIRVEKNTDR